MDITYIGAGTVRISGKTLNVVCDPTLQTAKSKALIKTGVVTWSTTDGLARLDDVMVLDIPGEFEVGGAMIAGVAARRHIDDVDKGLMNTMFSIVIDGVTVAVLGNVDFNITAPQLEALGKVDVLVIPVGGNGLTLDGTSAAGLVAKIEPSYVIPVHYADGVSTYEVPQDGVEVFLKEMGSNPEPVGKLRVSAKELPEGNAGGGADAVAVGDELSGTL